MGSVNRLVLVGRLGRSPEMRYTPEGQALTRFSLATDRPVKAGAERETDWHQVVSFGKVAEFAGQYLDRGRLVCVIGRITYRSWEGRDGQTRRMTEIVASDVVALDRKPDAEGVENAAEGNDEAVG
ncbi:MAG TPA: single-stranded DNA-binding protein [Candidatus Saccharimonadales bacterium]|nr:single-stranded DNA-binding protein [Candidatus Saccharimonadales bacterium]HVC33302.1 single-stranded DNA-binding protein [Chloroflexota bacterium]